MSALVVLSLLLQITCAVHAIKTGRGNTWLFIILAFSYLGCGLYFFMEMLPDIRNSRTTKSALKTLEKTIDPQVDLKRLAKNLRISDNVENKLKLAEECLAHNLQEEAADLYQSSLRGVYQHDPALMSGLARCRFQQGQYAESKRLLDELIQHNPDYKSPDGHLLYARTLEALGEEQNALEEYKTLAGYYAGAEAKCRYGLLLRKLGQSEQARQVFQQMLDIAADAPKFYRKAQKEWLDIARQHVAMNT